MSAGMDQGPPDQVLLAPLVSEKSTFVGKRTTSTYSACWRTRPSHRSRRPSS